MPTAQVRNASSQQLGTADHLEVQNKNFGAEWYDSVGGEVYIGAITIPLAAERINTAPEIYSMNSGVLTILEAGLYFFNFLVAASKAGSTEGSMYAYLEEDPATGVFAKVPATEVYATSFAAPASVVGSLLIRVGINYRYRIRAATHGVAFTTIADGSKFSVMRLFKNG